jgi:hypothetical protein
MSVTPLELQRAAVAPIIDKTRREFREFNGNNLPAPPPTSQPRKTISGAELLKPYDRSDLKPYDPNDDEAANGLFMLRQARGSTQPYPEVSAPLQVTDYSSVSVSPVRGVSEASAAVEETGKTRPNTRARGKRNAGNAGNATGPARRKADDTQIKAPAPKKSKMNNGTATATNRRVSQPSEDQGENGGEGNHDSGTDNKNLSAAEKRANFLERNRYVLPDRTCAIIITLTYVLLQASRAKVPATQEGLAAGAPTEVRGHHARERKPAE